MHYLGIDWGEKRIGLSYGDGLGVAVPLPAATGASIDERLQKIALCIEQRKIDVIVVGYPYNMDGSVGAKVEQVEAFIALLEQKFSLPVHRSDERLTTYHAEQSSRSLKLKDSRSSGALDSRAATLVLQDFLDQLPTVDR